VNTIQSYRLLEHMVYIVTTEILTVKANIKCLLLSPHFVGGVEGTHIWMTATNTDC
jgi:hypothetical protein